MNELSDRIQGAKIFEKIEQKAGFYTIRVKEGDKWKTEYLKRYGLYQHTVMPFGLSNAPAILQDDMEAIIRDILDRELLIYIMTS